MKTSWTSLVVLSFAIACGDDSTSASGGGAVGGGGASQGGEAQGGAAQGGSPNGGAPEGGGGTTSSGGAAEGGGGGGCVPQCTDRECGPDACGDACGTCGADEACSPQGQCVSAPSGTTSFFVTSVGNQSGNFGGLAGADAYCQNLATLAGLGERTWHAYLSSAQENARDRIGTGPWFNSVGDNVGADVASLHANGIAMDRMLDELTQTIPMNEHDILTGSTQQGTSTGQTCNDWTSDGEFSPNTWVGHTNAPNPADPFDNWNSTHETTGCGIHLPDSAGAGRIYCFAID